MMTSRNTRTLVLFLASLGYASAQICQDVPEVAAIRSNYPPTLQIATIPSNDSDATSLYNAMLDTNNPLLDVNPKGSPAADLNFTGVDYPADDPDCWWSFNKCTTPKAEDLEEDISTCAEPGTWGLTFDDGPVCGNELLYDYLRGHDLKATLYYIGGNVITFPEQAQRGIEDGHQICGHSWSHHSMTSLTNEQAFAELYYTKMAIKQVLGVTIKCWRPPYGDVDDRIRYIANFLGMPSTDIWDNDTNDWQIGTGNVTRADVADNYREIIQTAGNQTHGTIVLTHEVNNETQSEFISQFPTMMRSFDHFVPVTVCVNESHPYVEEDITFPTFEEFVGGDGTPNVTASVDGDATLEDVLSTVSADPSDTVISDDAQSTSRNDGSGGGRTNSDSAESNDEDGAGFITTSSPVLVSLLVSFLALLNL